MKKRKCRKLGGLYIPPEAEEWLLKQLPRYVEGIKLPKERKKTPMPWEKKNNKDNSS